MRILIANDDGYLAPGIAALVEACQGLGEIDVFAPERNASGTSNALTLHQPLSLHTAANGFRYVSGTPSDSVHLALTAGLIEPPDLVLSGINNGANMGDDTLYSGTVGAAMEGYLFGIPAIAVSQIDKGWAHLDAAASTVARMVQQMMDQSLIGTRPWLLNVNIPNLPLDQIKPPKVCRLGRRHAAEPVITQVDPRGQTMYWIGAAGAAMDDSAGTDFHAADLGHVVVTPLKVDLTEHDHLQAWSQTCARLWQQDGA